MRRLLPIAVLMLNLGIAAAQTTKTRKTDAEIKQEIIKESIASYRGSCPCPYNTDRAVRRSVTSKTLTPKMVDDYRKRTGQ